MNPPTSESDGATPLDPDEVEGLIPTHITTLEERNEWEQANIVRAEFWAFAQPKRGIPSSAFVRELHRRMFDQTWTWAGQFRITDKNIGVPRETISVALHDLCENVKFWLDGQVYQVDEAAARFHYHLAHIHPFPNGNGRHARLMTDVLLVSLQQQRFSWGRSDLRQPGAVRLEYITTLQAADAGDFQPLLDFLLRDRTK